MNIEDMPLSGKKVLVRVDFNVPIKNGKIIDDTRIKKSLKTINYLLEKKALVTLCSHLGRPKGKDTRFSLNPIATRLRELGYKVILTLDCIGNSVYKSQIHQDEKTIILLENLRFYKEEKENDFEFAKKLAEPFDLFIQDAFGVCHRNAASVSSLPEILPSAMGFLLKEEIKKLSLGLKPKKPFIVIMGGSKISSKLNLIRKFVEKSNYILLGGAMIFTFYKAMGLNIGKSLYEEEMINEAKKLLNYQNIILPDDIIISKEIKENAEIENVDFNKIKENYYGLDIGEKSILKFKRILSKAETVLWNGPMGMFEIKPFDNGTKEIAKMLSESKGKIIVGGGDSVAAINQLNLKNKFYHISTGGGASLEYLEGKELPGIKALEY